jgi:hypothetical protein
VFGDQAFSPFSTTKRLALWFSSTSMPSAEARGDQLRDLRVFADHQARQHLHLRDLGAEAGEGLRQLAADRPAAEHHQAFRQFAQIPDVSEVR